MKKNEEELKENQMSLFDLYLFARRLKKKKKVLEES
jgi:hypothetical protein